MTESSYQSEYRRPCFGPDINSLSQRPLTMVGDPWLKTQQRDCKVSVHDHAFWEPDLALHCPFKGKRQLIWV